MAYHIKAKVASCMKKSGRRELGDDAPNQFLSLIHPDVTDELLKFLDQRSLLALRSVCMQTKSWIDVTKHLTRIRIILNGGNLSKKIRKIVKSVTNFSNFVIGREALQNKEFLRDFTENLGEKVRILEISAVIEGRALLRLLSGCPFIESLTLFGINFEKKPRSITHADTTQSADLQQKLVENLQNLKILKIEQVLFKEEAELINLNVFFFRCCNLQKLKLPLIKFEFLIIKAERSRIMQQYVLEPLVKYLRRRRRSGGSNLKSLILETNNPLQSKVFIDLVTECFRGQIILQNVHQAFLQNLDYSQRHILEPIRTLTGLNGSTFLGNLNNLECLSVWISSAFLLSERNLENARLPSLACLNLFIDSVKGGPHRLIAFLDVLIRTERKSVWSLTVSSLRNDISSSKLIRPFDIADNFQFLKRLRLYKWDGTDREFLDLWGGLGMHRVEDLSLLFCRNLTDRGLIGGDENNPAILKLTGLKYLHISSVYGGITDLTLELAIRHIKLRSFRLFSHGVTLAGYKCLLDPPFCSEIQLIQCTRPIGCSLLEFTMLLEEIKKRKYRLEEGNPESSKNGRVSTIKRWLAK